MNKQDLWPKEGKLKKGLIILAIVVVGSLAIVFIEEQSGIKISKKVPAAIALAAVGVWLYQPTKKEEV